MYTKAQMKLICNYKLNGYTITRKHIKHVFEFYAVKGCKKIKLFIVPEEIELVHC